jgi:hypothetical protein
MMEKALIAYLIAHGIAGGRVYPAPPQGVTFPYVAVTRITGGPEYDDDGEAGLERGTVQVDCRALTFGEAKDLADLVRPLVSGVHDVAQVSVTFPMIYITAERDSRESGANATSYIFTTSLDLDVWRAT